MPDVSLDDIYDLSEKALICHGAAPKVAASVARATRRAEQTGNIICGLYYLESYCQQLASGRVNGTVSPEVSRQRPSVVAVNAMLGFAQPAFEAGLPEAVSAARENGIATLTVAHAHTCTSLGYFTEAIAKEGLIGLGFTNAPPAVAPPGGKTPILGTNPFAYSMPDGRGGVAVHYDAATTVVAKGAITQAAAAGRSIPEGWGVDPDGNPTTDPNQVLKGAQLSLGGPKGWGLSVLVELMAAGLTGSQNSFDIAGLKLPEGPAHDIGQTYLLIDPAGHSADFATRLLDLKAAVAADEGARLPGSPRKDINPVAVDDSLWTKLTALAS